MNTFYIVFLLVLFYFVFNHNETFSQHKSCENMNMTVFKQFNSIGLSWYDENKQDTTSNIQDTTSYKIKLMSEDGKDNLEYTYTPTNIKGFHTFIFPKKDKYNKKYTVTLSDSNISNICSSKSFYIDIVKNGNSDTINYIKCNPDSTYNIKKGKRSNICIDNIFPMSKDEFKKSSDTLNEIDKTLEKLSSSEEKVLNLDAT